MEARQAVREKEWCLGFSIEKAVYGEGIRRRRSQKGNNARADLDLPALVVCLVCSTWVQSNEVNDINVICPCPEYVMQGKRSTPIFCFVISLKRLCFVLMIQVLDKPCNRAVFLFYFCFQ